MSDADKPYTFLHDNIPQWLQDMAQLENKVTAMQAEVTKVAVSVSVPNPKPDSLESMRRPTQLRAIVEETATSNDTRTDPLENCRRKSRSFWSGQAHGPLQSVQRQMVVVNYDGDMQKSFELLVRAIGTGRNMLRKARMEVNMNDLVALAISSDASDVLREDGEAPDVPSINYRPRMSSMKAVAAARRRGQPGVSGVLNPSVELLDTTDRLLESAQGLCEKAAHLTLRQGDCRKELGLVRKSFDDAFENSKIAIDKTNARKVQLPHESTSQHASDTSVSSIDPSGKLNMALAEAPPPDADSRLKTNHPSVPVILAPSAPLAPTTLAYPEIELDDGDSDEGVEFVMPPVRLMSRLSARP